MSLVHQKDDTSVSVVIKIIDSTNGTPETGVVFNTSGIDLSYRREGAAVVAITEADLTTPALTDAWASGGFLAIGHGYYRLDVPDAAFATGVSGVLIFGTVTGMVVIGEYVQLVDYDPFDAVRMGMTALPNAAADATGGLPISDAGGLDLDAMNTAAVRLTAVRAAVLTDWIDAGRLDLLLDAIPTTAMRGTDSAMLAANGALEATVAALNNITTAQVNTECDTALTDYAAATVTLPGQGAPPLTPTRDEVKAWLYKNFRNRKRQSATLWELYADNETTVDSKATISDSGGLAIKQEIVTGP